MNGKRFLILLSLTLSGVAWGQTACPQGVSPGDPRCGPLNGVSGIDMTPPPPRGPRWQLTWGAIAMDETTGDVGVTVGHFSRGKAKREALSRCATWGGGNCKIQLTYKNQCAVIARPKESGKFITPMQVGPSIEVASDLALSSCSANNGGRECKIEYSDCARPVLVLVQD